MRRTVLLTFVTLATILAITAIGSSDFTNDNKHAIHSQQQSLTPIVDGAETSSLIPDYAAHEVLLRLLSFDNSEDPNSNRKRAYTRLSGFNDEEAAALSLVAYNFKRRIDPLNDPVMAIKDRCSSANTLK